VKNQIIYKLGKKVKYLAAENALSTHGEMKVSTNK
jgi:hypothetical protein